MIETAKQYEELGLCPIPAHVKKDACEVKALWRSDPKDVAGWSSLFKAQNGIAIKLGVSSNGVQVIDVDQKHDSTVTLSRRFLEALKYMLPDTYDSFYVEETRSGGLHVFFKRTVTVENKFVPAKTLTIHHGKEIEAGLIEVLGEGNMVFTHPTPNYRIIQGSIEEIPTITELEYKELIDICKSFNELPSAEIEEHTIEVEGIDPNDKRAGTIFNKRCDPVKFAAFMVDNGWKVVKQLGEKYWFTRPDKDKGVSATFNHDGNKIFCVFSTSTCFDSTHPNGKLKGYRPFSVLAKLMFNDDYRATTKYLIERGYVDPDEWDDVELLVPVKAEPFNLDELLPEGCEDFKTFVNEVSNSYQVHPEMVVLPCLSVVSLCLSGAVRLKISDDWKEDAPIWSIVVAEASERKSPVLKEVMEPVEDYFRNFKKKFRSSLNKIARKRRALQRKIEKLETDYEKAEVSGKDTGSIDAELAMAELELDNTPEVTDLPNLLQSDITTEALVRQLKINGEVCGVISAEADPIEVALGLYSNQSNFTAYLKGFSVERYTSTRVGGGETVIEQPRVVLSVMMQREPMAKLAENHQAKKRGFLARCFFAVPSSKVGLRTLEPDPISQSARDWWASRLKSMLELPHRMRMQEVDGEVVYNEDNPKPIELSDEAKAVFLAAREENERGLSTDGDYDDGAGWGGKLMGNLCRLALTLHFLSGGGMRSKISGETMKAAVAWAKPLNEHFYCACGAIGEMSIDKKVHAAIKKMAEHGVEDGMTINDIVQKIKTRKLNKQSDFEPIFNRMIELGMIRIQDGEKPKRGPTPKLVKLHPNFVNLAQ